MNTVIQSEAFETALKKSKVSITMIERLQHILNTLLINLIDETELDTQSLTFEVIPHQNTWLFKVVPANNGITTFTGCSMGLQRMIKDVNFDSLSAALTLLFVSNYQRELLIVCPTFGKCFDYDLLTMIGMATTKECQEAVIIRDRYYPNLNTKHFYQLTD